LPDAALVLLISAVALGLYLYRAGDVSLWYDEAFSLGLVHQGWGVLWTYLWGPESNMTLYYLLLRGWLRLAAWIGLAPVEWVARLPSIIFGALSVVVVFLLARRWSGRLVAVVAAGVYATNWLQLSLAPQARSYSLEILLVCISWYAFLASIDSAPGRKRGRWAAAYAGAAALAVYAHLFSIFVLVAQMVAFATLCALPGLLSGPVRRHRKVFFAGVAAAGVVILPLAVDVWLHGGAQLGIPPAHPGDLHRFFTYMSGKNRLYAALVLALALLAALAAALPYRPGRRAASPRPSLAPQPPTLVVPMLAWLIVPLALSFAVTQPYLNLHVFFNRYLVVVVPPLCLLAALGVAALRSRAAQVVVVLALMGAAWPQIPQYYADAQAQDFRTPARWLQQDFKDGDGLVCFPDNAACAIPMEYYLRAYPGPAHFTPGFPGSWSWERHLSSGVDQNIVAEYAARHSRFFFTYAPLEVTDPATALRARALRNWLDERYPLLAQSQAVARTSTIAVRLYASQGSP
jgi:hypothetical protein